jgi:hypothetical protein
VNQYDPLLDHRARIERAQADAAERRMRSFNDQRSPENSHEARVCAWETLHQLRLPASPKHSVLLIVARQTGLLLADVREVQRLRAGPASS